MEQLSLSPHGGFLLVVCCPKDGMVVRDIYPVPQNALYVSEGMNVLKFPKGKP